MNIPDGEYEIDLLELLENSSQNHPDTNSMAIRYGFIPDSMDQSKPLRLFQNTDVCIVEAQLVDNNTRGVSKPSSIIFEGIPHRQRPTQGQTSDTYYLAFDSTTEANKTPSVKLRQLGGTIRVSKTRNADKWRKAIDEWTAAAQADTLLPSMTKETDSGPSSEEKHTNDRTSSSKMRLGSSGGVEGGYSTGFHGKSIGSTVERTMGHHTQNPKANTAKFTQKSSTSDKININVKQMTLDPSEKSLSETSQKLSKSTATNTIRSSKSTKSTSTERQTKAAKSASQARYPARSGKSTVSSKAPPRMTTAASTLNASTSMKMATNESIPARATKNVTSKRPPFATPEVKEDIISVSDFEDLDSEQELEPSLNVPNVTKNPPQNPDMTDISLNDDFQDLEDQLEEVLEHSDDSNQQLFAQVENTTAFGISSDSDEEDDMNTFSGGPIIIDMGQSAPKPKNSNMRLKSSISRPTSLRDLYSGGKADDYSCSEEE